MPQDSPVFEDFTCWRNVTMGERFRDGSVARRAAALVTLENFGLAEHIDRLAGTLSGGQRQRLAFATALLNEPTILCCDEPLSALDAFTRAAVQRFYVEQVKALADRSRWRFADPAPALVEFPM